MISGKICIDFRRHYEADQFEADNMHPRMCVAFSFSNPRSLSLSLSLPLSLLDRQSIICAAVAFLRMFRVSRFFVDEDFPVELQPFD